MTSAGAFYGLEPLRASMVQSLDTDGAENEERQRRDHMPAQGNALGKRHGKRSEA
jgi:hypothetical protein